MIDDQIDSELRRILTATWLLRDVMNTKGYAALPETSKQQTLIHLQTIGDLAGAQYCRTCMELGIPVTAPAAASANGAQPPAQPTPTESRAYVEFK